ncbi:MAG: peptide chain release factor N(5)-glutamine methyltransferase [Pseudomonadota bacterium]
MLDQARARIPLREARLLLARCLGASHAQLAARPERPVDPENAARYRAWVERRAAGEPIAYLTGNCEFYGLEFRVTPAVLIPRPETELLVDLALERLPVEGRARVLDLGTGSGCIAVSLGRQRPRMEVWAADAVPAALEVARDNALRLGATVRFVRSDWLADLAGERFDLILSNPPYVAAGDPHLSRGDLRFEPASALVAGEDGLNDIRRIVAAAPAHLAPGGWLLFEHGYDQAQRCRALLTAAGFGQVTSWRDLAGIERVSGGCMLETQS